MAESLTPVSERGALAGSRSPRILAVGAVLAVCGVVLLAVAALVALTEHPFGYFSRDPASTLVASPFVGLLSYAGVLLTWGTAVTCAFAGALVSYARGRREAVPLLAASAGTAYLALDDLLLLHDDVFPQKVGIAQGAVLIAYAIVALAFLWWFRDVFRRYDWPLLAVATVALAIALALDFEEIHHHIPFVEGELKVWLEDSLKLFGLGFLSAFFFLMSLRMVTAVYARPVENARVVRETDPEAARPRVPEVAK